MNTECNLRMSDMKNQSNFYKTIYNQSRIEKCLCFYNTENGFDFLYHVFDEKISDAKFDDYNNYMCLSDMSKNINKNKLKNYSLNKHIKSLPKLSIYKLSNYDI